MNNIRLTDRKSVVRCKLYKFTDLCYKYITRMRSVHRALVCKKCIKKQRNALNYTDAFFGDNLHVSAIFRVTFVTRIQFGQMCQIIPQYCNCVLGITPATQHSISDSGLKPTTIYGCTH